MKRTTLALSVVALALGIGIGSTAFGAPGASADPALDLELRAADAREVLTLVAGAQGKKIEVDPCVKAQIDVKLKNVPASVVESALIHKLGLVATDRDGTTSVGCAAQPAAR